MKSTDEKIEIMEKIVKIIKDTKDNKKELAYANELLNFLYFMRKNDKRI
jgi:hypothetical protein